MRLGEEKSNEQDASTQAINVLHAKFESANKTLKIINRNIAAISSNLKTKSKEYDDVNLAAGHLSSTVKSARELAASYSPSALMLDAKQSLLVSGFQALTADMNKLKLISSDSTKEYILQLTKLTEEIKDFIEKNTAVLSKNKLLNLSNESVVNLMAMIASVNQQLITITKLQDDLKVKREPIKLLFSQCKATVTAAIKLLDQAKPKVPAPNLLSGNQNNVPISNGQVMQPAISHLVK